MMKAKIIFIIILFCTFLYSCSENDEQIVELLNGATVLEGNWKIAEFHFKQNSVLIHEGNEVFGDTILRNLGNLEIESFKEKIQNTPNYEYIQRIQYSKLLENAEIDIVRFFRNPQGIFLSLRVSRITLNPDLSFTDLAKFLKSSNIFDRNVLLDIKDNNTIHLVDSNEPDQHLIILKRQ